MLFIAHYQVTSDQLKDVSYGRIILDYRTHKEEPHRKRLNVWGNLIDYAGDVRTTREDTTIEKLIINSNISTPRARYMC